MKKVFILLCISLVVFSCVRRRAGVHSNNLTPNTYNVEQRSRRTTNKITNLSDSKTYTGAQIFEKYNSAVFMVFTSDGYNEYQGSGFFVSSSGIAVSNYHVFEGTEIGYEVIKLSDGNSYKISKVIAISKEDDFIVFEVDSYGLSFNFIPLGNIKPKVGEKVYAIGSPLGFENTFSSGEISQLRGDNIIQINVPIDHGSSGGALINEYGQVIGITTAGLDNSGANLNFAMSIDVVKPYL